MGNVPTWAWAIVGICLIVSVPTVLGFYIAENSGQGNVITDFWNVDSEHFMDTDGDGIRDDVDTDDDNDGILDVNDPEPKIPSIVTTGGKVLVSLDVYRRGVEATDPDPTGYFWYDWDLDGKVDLGSYDGLDDNGALITGEIETVSSSSGILTSKVHYPSGGWVYIQMQKSLYGTRTVKYQVPAKGANDLTTTVHSLGSTWMMLTETDSTDRVRVTATGSSPVLMVTESTGYNYTTYGASPTIEVRITCATDDMGIGTDAYVDWSTGKNYVGSFMAIALTNADNSDVTLTGYDDVKTDGTHYWYIFNLAELWNDASIDSDGAVTKTLSATISGDFDFAYINVFPSLLQTTYDAGSLTSGQTLQETNLDFVA